MWKSAENLWLKFSFVPLRFFLVQKWWDKRDKVVEDFKTAQEASKNITKILEDSELAEQITNSRDHRQLVEYLVKTHSVSKNTFSTVKV